MAEPSSSCAKSEAWETRLRARCGSAARRGSAPVIDTLRSNQIAHLHAFIQSPRSISPTPTVLEDESEPSPSAIHSEEKDGLPSRYAVPLLRVSPASSPSETRRPSDTNIRRGSMASGEAIAVPVSGGRRHSDLGSLLTLNSKRNNLALQRCHACQACLSLRQKPREESPHRPSLGASSCEHSGTPSAPCSGRLRGSSDCSDFSFLQQSLINIIGRRVAPCNATTPNNPLLQPSAAQRPVYSDGDIRMKSRLLSGLVGEKEPPENCEDSFCAAEQQCSGAETRVVGHSSRHLFSLPMRGRFLLN